MDQSASCNESYIENLRKFASQLLRPQLRCTALFSRDDVPRHVLYSFPRGHSSFYRSDICPVVDSVTRLRFVYENLADRQRRKNRMTKKSVSALYIRMLRPVISDGHCDLCCLCPIGLRDLRSAASARHSSERIDTENFFLSPSIFRLYRQNAIDPGVVDQIIAYVVHPIPRLPHMTTCTLHP